MIKIYHVHSRLSAFRVDIQGQNFELQWAYALLIWRIEGEIYYFELKIKSTTSFFTYQNPKWGVSL